MPFDSHPLLYRQLVLLEHDVPEWFSIRVQGDVATFADILVIGANPKSTFPSFAYWACSLSIRAVFNSVVQRHLRCSIRHCSYFAGLLSSVALRQDFLNALSSRLLRGKYNLHFLGLFAIRALGVEIAGGQMVFNSFSTLADNAANCLVGFFRLFGAVTREKTSVLRLSGFAQLFCWLLSLLMLFCMLRVLYLLLHQKGAQLETPVILLSSLALWNFFFLLLLCTNYGDPYFEVRYHLIGGIPLLLLLAIYFQKFRQGSPQRVQKALDIVCPLFMCCLIVLCDRRAYNVYWHTDGTVGINQKERALCDVVDTLDVTDVFILQSNTTAEICGLLDPDHHYKQLWLQEDSCILQTFDGPLADTDAEVTTAPAALVVPPETTLTELPYYLQNVEQVAQTSDYIIYLLDNGSLPDGVVGLPYTGTGLDYPNSVGYIYQGTVDENRCLDTDGHAGIVLQSPNLKLKDTTDVCLSYSTLESASAVIGTVSLSQNGKVIQTQELTADASAITLAAVPSAENCQLTVDLLPGARVELQYILFSPSAS